MRQNLDNLTQIKASDFPVGPNSAALNWLNLICFKLSWLGLVIYQNQAIWFSLLMLFICLCSFNNRQFFWHTTAAIFIAGTVLDQALLLAGIFDFGRNLLPAWLLMLWAIFALTLPHGFSFIGKLSLLAQICIGACSGMLSYSAGMTLGAVQFPLGTNLTVLMLGGLWGMLLPLFFIIHRTLKT